MKSFRDEIDILWNALQHCKSSFVELKMEPFILHVECRDISAAKRMHQTAIASGFRNSGISISAADRMIVAVRSTIKMDIPCIVNGTLLVTREQMEIWVTVANDKMQKNWSMMCRLEEAIKKLCEGTFGRYFYCTMGKCALMIWIMEHFLQSSEVGSIPSVSRVKVHDKDGQATICHC